MSLRPHVVSAPVSSRTRLQHVLLTGLEVGTSVGALGTPAIAIDGVEVSTDPNHWTALSVNQIVKLKLVPVDMAEFNRKGLANRDDPNAAYDGTEFKSNVEGPYENFRLWVVHLGVQLNVDAAGYYVIARPNSDMRVYRPAMGLAP